MLTKVNGYLQNDIRKDRNFSSFKKRFLSNMPKDCFEKENEDECWEWQGSKNHQGYGTISLENKHHGAHRMSYIIFNGLIPYNEIIRHTCDNPSCVNPAHLLLGSKQDNSLDSVKAATQRSVILNEEAVKVIKWLLKYRPKYGLSAKLARLHNVTQQNIYAIKQGRSWGWVKVESH